MKQNKFLKKIDKEAEAKKEEMYLYLAKLFRINTKKKGWKDFAILKYRRYLIEIKPYLDEIQRKIDYEQSETDPLTGI